MLASVRSAWWAFLLMVWEVGSPNAGQAQHRHGPAPTDTLRTLETLAAASGSPPRPQITPWYRGKLLRATIVPAVLIGYGASTINNNGFYSSYKAKQDLRDVFGPYRTRRDHYLPVVPYLGLGAALLSGIETKNDPLNLALVIVKGEALMLTSVFLVKEITRVERPDSADYHAFPSGHTAQAFLAASIVHAELRHRSQWYGVGAYALASSVGVLRMINNKHWKSDVVAGAGFGILSAHLAYLSHRHRWGRRPVGRGIGEFTVLPAWSPAGGPGISLSWRAK